MTSNAEHDRRLTRLENDTESLYELLDAFKLETRNRFDAVEARLTGIDTRLTGIDTRLDGIETRFDEHDRRFDTLEAGITEILRRLPEAG